MNHLILLFSLLQIDYQQNYHVLRNLNNCQMINYYLICPIIFNFTKLNCQFNLPMTITLLVNLTYNGNKSQVMIVLNLLLHSLICMNK